MLKKNKNNLAINGGRPVCEKFDPFNTIGQQEIRAVTKVLKSGTKRLTAKKISPAMLGPDDLPLASLCLCCRSKSKDLIKEGTIVVEPSSLT